jgi:hypothetical protein
VIELLVVVLGIFAAGFGTGYITRALVDAWRWRRYLDGR